MHQLRLHLVSSELQCLRALIFVFVSFCALPKAKESFLISVQGISLGIPIISPISLALFPLDKTFLRDSSFILPTAFHSSTVLYHFLKEFAYKQRTEEKPEEDRKIVDLLDKKESLDIVDKTKRDPGSTEVKVQKKWVLVFYCFQWFSFM